MSAAGSIRWYGGVAVPWTVSWTGEETGFHLAPCPWARREALCQPVAPGVGKPKFGAPHSQRQRTAIAAGLCDLCGRLLTARTKVSLSHARVQAHGAEGPAVLQVEPLLHRECAGESLRHCPALRRDITAGTLRVRQVTRHRVQFALMDAEYTYTMTGQRRIAVGHAKVELLKWIDRTPAWLERGA